MSPLKKNDSCNGMTMAPEEVAWRLGHILGVHQYLRLAGEVRDESSQFATSSGDEKAMQRADCVRMADNRDLRGGI